MTHYPDGATLLQQAFDPRAVAPDLRIAVAVILVTMACLAALAALDGAAVLAGRCRRPSQSDVSGVADQATVALGEISASEQRRLAVARLRRFAALAALPDVRSDRGRRRLVERALFAAYCDCQRLGLGQEARLELGSSAERLASAG
jgi:hypothetical protein